MDGLQFVNKFWQSETRDAEMQRLRKQKHAAHSNVHRLKRKIKEMEIARRLLLVAFLATANANSVLHERIERYVSDMDNVSEV